MRKLLSGKEIKELLEELPLGLKVFSKKDKLEIFDNIYKLNDKPFLIVIDEKNRKMIPHLKFLQTISSSELLKFNVITIDMGAVKFVVSGADIMRPGIKNMEGNFQKDDHVIIIDINNKKPLSVGLALFSSEEMKNMTGGKVIKNIHYVGDEFWKIN